MPRAELGLATMAVVGFGSTTPGETDAFGLAGEASMTYESTDHLYLAAGGGGLDGCFDCFTRTPASGVDGTTHVYDFALDGTSATSVDMGNPHVVAVIEDAFSTLPVVEDLDLVTKPVVNPTIESDQNVEFVRIDDIDHNTAVGEATMRVNERGCGETLSCGTGLCATGIVLRAKTGISHWDITVRGGTLRVDVTDEDVKLTGSATLVADIDLLRS